jgi:phosphatidylglycerophosphatase A
VGATSPAKISVADYGGIVWDEIVAFMLVLFFTPPGWDWALLAFALFRLSISSSRSRSAIR